MTDWQRKPRHAPDGLVLAASIASATSVVAIVGSLTRAEWWAAAAWLFAAIAFAWVALERRER